MKKQMVYGGALSAEQIKELVESGFVAGVKIEQIRCGSVDLTVSDEIYRVYGAFLPKPHESVKDAIYRMGGVRIDSRSILERGCCYVFRLNESIKMMPRGLYGYCNPKSSSGRVDIHVRLLADRMSRYDAIPANYVGDLWVLVIPKTFPVIVPQGMALNQLRFFNQDTRFDELRLEMQMSRDGGLINKKDGTPILYKDIVHSDRDGSIILTLGLEYEHPGFEAIETAEPIDLGQVHHYDPKVFFRPVFVQSGAIALRAGSFYILSTLEYVRVPAHLACEMVPMDERSGDLRSHYAGFIDPGWGIGSDGAGLGRPLTLEVRSFDTSLVVCHGQPIAKIRYERMREAPVKHYDQMTSNYIGQSGPKFGKFFQEWK